MSPSSVSAERLISNSMTPVATARLSESARPACGMRSSRSQLCGELVGQPLLLVAHQEQHRPAREIDRAVVDRALEMGSGDQPGKALAPGQEGFLRGLGDRHGEDRAHRRAHRFQRERIGGFPDQDHALRADRVGGADDGSEIAGIAHAVERHPDVAPVGPDVLQRHESLREHADDRLRIVAPGDGGQHLLRHFEHRAARRDRARRHLFHRRVAARRLGEDQRHDRPAEVERVDDELQPLGHEGVLLVAEFLQRQRLDVLDQRIGEAGDFLDLARRAAGALPAHGAIQREKSEVDSARPADFSRMISSPDSTVPPMPANVSRISAWMAKNEARME